LGGNPGGERLDSCSLDALWFICVFLSGIAAGGLVLVGVYGLALRALPPESIARVHSKLHPMTHRVMQTSTLVAAAAAVAVGVWDDPGWRASTVLIFVGLVGVAAQAILSRFWVIPMSDEMIEWGKGDPPADYLQFLRRWTILHGGRVLGGLEAFFCYLLALILR
jgi:hypothetical protein